MQKNLNRPTEPTIADTAPWHRWERDGRRLAGVLGFKPFGVAAIALIVVYIWLDGATSAVAQARHDRDETVAELTHMRTLASMRGRIESGLKSAGPQLESARARGLAGASVDEAVIAWRSELQAAIQAQNIADVTSTPVPASRHPGALPVVGVDMEFLAVPQQLLAITDSIQHASRYERIAKLDLVPDMTLASPRLHVKMRVEAPYFPPKTNGPAAGGGRPATVAR